MNLDAYMDDFGRDLHRAARRRRTPRRFVRLLPALPVAAALAVALAVLPNGGGSVDAVAAARAALAPDGEIVHMKIEMGTAERVYSEIEQWFAADPDRWRSRFEPRSGAPRATRSIETAYLNDRMRFYDLRTDVVTIWRGRPMPQSAGPSPFGGDPATELREQLGKGDVRDDGVVTVEGRAVRRLVREEAQRGFTQRFVYYIDPTTFAPIGGHLLIGRSNGRLVRGPTFTVTEYERIPLTEQSERLLKFERTPDTKYVWR